MTKLAALVLLGACTSAAPATDAHTPTKIGSVTVSSNTGVGTASASFSDADACAPTATVATCTVLPCRYPPPSAMYSAGVVTITGTSIPISLNPGSDNAYLFETEGALYTGGESLMVTAAGAEVPAFAAAMTAPSGATITSPAQPTAAISITRSDGFTFTWTGGTAGDVRAVIDVGPQGPELECRFDAAMGTATIPPAALMMLPASSQAQLSFEAANEQAVVAGDWAVSFSAHTRAIWTTGNFANAGATLQ